MPEMKPWKCKTGHVLGQVRWKGHGDSQLILFREAIDLDMEQPAEQEVAGVVEGYVTLTWSCSICRNERTWVPGEEALARLIASHQRMVKNQLEEQTL